MNNDNKKLDDCQFVVYVIWDSKNNKYYVGVTRQKYAYTRIRQHKRGKQFVDRELQKVGWENCDWWVVEENIPAENIDEREKQWICFFGCVYPKGYNMTHGGIGHITVSEETREKIRQNALERGMSGEKNPMFGKHHSEEARAKISEARKLENLSDETRAKMSAAQKGKKASPETKAKLSASRTGEKNGFYGKHHTEEAKEKNRQAHIGKPSARKGTHHTEETKAKLREKALERDVRGERNPFFGKHHTPEAIEKNRQAHIGQPAWNKGKHPSAETRAKMSAAAKARCARQKAAKENAANQDKTS